MRVSFPCPECNIRLEARCRKKSTVALEVLQRMEKHCEESVLCGQALFGNPRQGFGRQPSLHRKKNVLRAIGNSSPTEKELGL